MVLELTLNGERRLFELVSLVGVSCDAFLIMLMSEILSGEGRFLGLLGLMIDVSLIAL